ncbi:UGSC family (seleno)protein [Pseudonocardia sp. GCM10023141]|uniref:UGSC family (seleno)protein n=1 Tax=Pseudonocardia sp. GCM10023141 TaxID=3252653 RepID=UPI003612338A
MTDWARTILDPTSGEKSVLDTRLAPRPTTLDGLTLCLLDNGKANGGLLLSEVAGALGQRFRLAGVEVFVKDDAGTTLPDAMLHDLVALGGVAVTAIGDCGSCSAATVADGIELERVGVPTVSICSDAFRLSAATMADTRGFPGYEYVSVGHPVASLDLAGVRTRVTDALPRILAILGADG